LIVAGPTVVVGDARSIEPVPSDRCGARNRAAHRRASETLFACAESSDRAIFGRPERRHEARALV
jgi:hypothetical protein